MIKINQWLKPSRVKAISENYVFMDQKCFGKQWYSVIEKKVRTAGDHNAMMAGMFHCGPDDYVFGCPIFTTIEDFSDPKKLEAYLKLFEDGEAHLSERNSVAIVSVSIKRPKEKKYA